MTPYVKEILLVGWEIHWKGRYNPLHSNGDAKVESLKRGYFVPTKKLQCAWMRVWRELSLRNGMMVLMGRFWFTGKTIPLPSKWSVAMVTTMRLRNWRHLHLQGRHVLGCMNLAIPFNIEITCPGGQNLCKFQAICLMLL